MTLKVSDGSSFVLFKFNLIHMKRHGFNDFLHIGFKISAVHDTGFTENTEPLVRFSAPLHVSLAIMLLRSISISRNFSSTDNDHRRLLTR